MRGRHIFLRPTHWRAVRCREAASRTRLLLPRAIPGSSCQLGVPILRQFHFREQIWVADFTYSYRVVREFLFKSWDFETQHRLVYYKWIVISWLVEVAQRWLEAQTWSDARDKSTEPKCIALLCRCCKKLPSFLCEVAIHRASRIEDQVCDTRVACATSTTMLYRRFVVSRTIYAVTHYICSVTQDSTVRRYVSQSPWNVECVNIACWRYGILLTKAADTMREYFALLYKQDN